ncbi:MULTISPECIES: restriction endonuclease subunit S [unclassified Streptomyces]|uniref:restriction endonuclease subunit S n=1 Tax=unclassified Streptomyces TaxID=2593676 RepID=UPI0036583AD5
MANEEWAKVRLSEVLERSFAGAWGESPSDSRVANICVLRATNLDAEGGIDYSSPAFRIVSARESVRKKLIPGDLIVEASGGGPGTPVGRVALFVGGVAGVSYICSNFFRVLRPNLAIVNPTYLASFLAKAYHSPGIWRYQQQTTGLVNLRFKDYLEQPLVLPPLHEQRRIVEAIDAVSEQERAIKASIAKLEALSAGVMAELSDVECGTFEEVLEYGPQNGIYKPGSSYGIEGTPIVRIDSFRGGPSDFSGNLLRVSLSKGEVDRYGLVEGDILINRVNTPELVGKSTAVGDLMESTVFESNMMRCRLRADRAVSAFVETWLGGPTVKTHFRARAKSAISQASINSGDVRSCPFPKVDISRQLEFLERLSAVREQQQIERVELVKLGKIKQGIVDDLLGSYVRT